MSQDIPRQIFPRFDKTATRSTFDKNQKKFPEHRKLIRACPCIIPGCGQRPECAHIRFSDAEFGKLNPGVGSRPHDKWCLPLCNWHHQSAPDAQHKMNEQEFWDSYGINSLDVALKLWEETGNLEKMCEIVRNRG